MNQAISDNSLPPLEPDNDPQLVLRAKRAVDALKADRNRTLVEGDIVDWQLWDEQGTPCVRGMKRAEARELKRLAGGVVVKVVVSH